MTFSQWIARPGRQIVYAAEIQATRKSDGQDITLYLADHGGQWDGAHNFRPYLRAPERLRRSAQGLTGRSSLASYGDLTFAAVEGRPLDSDGLLTADEILSDYTLEGRSVTVRVGGPGLAYANWWVVLQGIMGQPEFDNAEARVPITSPVADLVAKQIPPNEYQSGPDSVVGRPIPLVLGRCRNISPLLIDETAHRYQFHDPAFGPVQAVDTVRVDGQVVTSGYSLDLAQGTITFSSEPSGQVTLDVRGRVSNALGGYVELVGDLVQDLLRSFAGAGSEQIDTDAFASYNSAVPWPAGIYLEQRSSIHEVIDALLTGLLTVFSDTPDGRYTLRRLEDTTGTEDLSLKEGDILRESFRSRPDTLGPAWRVTVEGRRNWTVISSPASGVSEADRQWLRESYLRRTAQDTSIQDLYPRARELGPYQTYLAEPAHLEALAARWLDLYGRERRRVELVTRLVGLPAALGDLVMVRRRRHGMASGVPFRVVGTEEDHRRRVIRMELWG